MLFNQGNFVFPSLRGGTTKQTSLLAFWFASGKALAMTDTSFA